MCGLSLLLVLYSAPRGLPLGAPVFSPPQKPTFPNSNSSMDSWFRRIRDPRAWGACLAPGFDFGEKKSCLFWVDPSPTLPSASLRCHFIIKER